MRMTLAVALIICTFLLNAQDGKYQMGAASAAVGGSSLTVTNAWALFNNVGGIGALDETSTFVTYQNKYDVSSFQTVGGGFVHSMNFATAGVGFYHFGDEIYGQQRATLAIGNKLQMVSLGAAINVIQYNAEGLDTRRRVALEFGGVVEIIPQLSFGAHIFNFRESDVVPTVMKAGLSYRPSDQLMINVETQKELGFGEVFKAGLEYQLIAPLYLRTGISTRPFKSAFGFGLIIKHFLFDYAYGANPNLGGIHEISLTYKLRSE